MPKLKHYDNLGTARFVTFSCFRRHRYLNSMLARKTVIAELAKLREALEIKILGYVIMPEHVHLVLWPPDKMRLGPVIGQLKGRISKQILSQPNGYGSVLKRADGNPAVWQRRCYDHNCRLPKIVLEKINHCHHNPVNGGLSRTPDDWAWSSSRWYSGSGEVMMEIDGYEI